MKTRTQLNTKSKLNDLIIEFDSLFLLLPDELLLQIISHVPHDSLPALRLVNSRLNNLCHDYLFKNHQPVNVRWRLRFFEHKQEDLNDDIEEENDSNSCKGSLSLLGTGIILTLAGAYKSGDIIHDPDTSNTLLTFFSLYMLASLGLLIWGLIKVVKAHQSGERVDSMYHQISQLNDDIEKNVAKLPRKM